MNIKKETMDAVEYRCGECLETFTDLDALGAHISTEHDNLEIVMNCSYCSEEFADVHTLQAHLNSDARVSCKFCNETCCSNAHLARHVDDEHGEEYLCKHCGGIFLALDLFTNHEAMGKRTCHSCDKVFCFDTDLADHQCASCKYCPENFVTLNELETHVTDTHKHLCRKCDIAFDTATEKANHMVTHTLGQSLKRKSEDGEDFDAKRSRDLDDDDDDDGVLLDDEDGEIQIVEQTEPVRVDDGTIIGTKTAVNRTTSTRQSMDVTPDLTTLDDGECRNKTITIIRKDGKREKSIVCSYCDTRFDADRREFRNHLKIHSIYQCEFCDVFFRTALNLHSHIQQYHPRKFLGKKNTTFLCNICKQSFFDTITLSVHMRSHAVQGKRKVITRNVVGNKLVLPITGNTHNARITVINSKDQSVTTYRVINPNSTDRVPTKKSDPIIIAPPSLARIQKKPTILSRAISKPKLVTEKVAKPTIVTPKRHYTLNVNEQIQVIGHPQANPAPAPPSRYTKVDRFFVCNFCQKSFQSLSSLSTHVRIHTGEKPFKCGFCEKAFCQKGDLDKHTRKHTGEKPYSCDYCEKAFTRSETVKTHVQKMHNGGIQMVCRYCMRTFNMRSSLRSHIEKKHKKQMKYVPPDESLFAEVDGVTGFIINDDNGEIITTDGEVTGASTQNDYPQFVNVDGELIDGNLLLGNNVLYDEDGNEVFLSAAPAQLQTVEETVNEEQGNQSNENIQYEYVVVKSEQNDNSFIKYKYTPTVYYQDENGDAQPLQEIHEMNYNGSQDGTNDESSQDNVITHEQQEQLQRQLAEKIDEMQKHGDDGTNATLSVQVAESEVVIDTEEENNDTNGSAQTDGANSNDTQYVNSEHLEISEIITGDVIDDTTQFSTN